MAKDIHTLMVPMIHGVFATMHRPDPLDVAVLGLIFPIEQRSLTVRTSLGIVFLGTHLGIEVGTAVFNQVVMVASIAKIAIEHSVG